MGNELGIKVKKAIYKLNTKFILIINNLKTKT